MKRLLLLSLTCLTAGQAFCAERASQEEMQYEYAQFARDNFKPKFAQWDGDSNCFNPSLNEEQKAECAHAKTFWKDLYQKSDSVFFKEAWSSPFLNRKAIVPSVDYFATKECDKLPDDQRKKCAHIHHLLRHAFAQYEATDGHSGMKKKGALHGTCLGAIAGAAIGESKNLSLQATCIGVIVGLALGTAAPYVLCPEARNYSQEWHDIQYKSNPMKNLEKGLLNGLPWENQTPEDYKAFVQFYNKHKYKINWRQLQEDTSLCNGALRARVIAGHFQADNDSQA